MTTDHAKCYMLHVADYPRAAECQPCVSHLNAQKHNSFTLTINLRASTYSASAVAHCDRESLSELPCSFFFGTIPRTRS